MKKLFVGAVLAVAVAFAYSPAFAACADLDGDGAVDTCCDGDPAPDPNNPPSNACGSILVPGVAEIAGCINESGVAGCVVVAEQGVIGGDTMTPPDSITLGEDCEERAVQACVDCGCDVPAP